MGGVEYFENGYIPDCLILLLGVLALEHYLISKDDKYLKWVLITEYSTLFFLIITSIPQFVLLPNLTRMLNRAEDPSAMELEYYWSISYATVHNLPVLCIPFFAWFSVVNKIKLKITIILCIISILIVMILASSTTSLLLLVATYLFFMVYNKKMSIFQNAMRLLLVFLVLSPFLNKHITASFLDTVIKPVFEGSNTSKKIDEIKYYILTGDTSGDMEAREDIYQTSIDAILENPLFPEFNNEKIGHHSDLLDHCAAMGLFIFIPYLYFLFSRYRRPVKYIPNVKFYHFISFCSFLVLAILKNFFVFTSALLIVPLFLIQLENKYYKLHE